MEYDYLFEIYPDEIQARLEAQRRFSKNLPANVGDVGLEFVIETLKRWDAGQTITVAFRGGDSTLHKRIAEAAAEWSNYGNFVLDFGYDADTQQYRQWSPGDTDYEADIRISFNQAGYWSLVGTDSKNPIIISPGQASMNFGGFAFALPQSWRGTVLHEFGHALAFQHEHQHPVGGCDLDFRWEDDPGYMPTVDGAGQFIADDNNRRPGIYTVLGGPPNRWPEAKVNHNLRQLSSSHAFMVGPFDPKSIMKYHFGEWMFRDGSNSHCFSQRNDVLSAQDKVGVSQAYPSTQAAMKDAKTQKKQFLETLIKEGKNQPEMKESLTLRLESLEEQ